MRDLERKIPGFNQAESHSHKIIQSEFGEMFFHISMLAVPNKDPVPDKRRPAYTLPAIFDWESKDFKLGLKEMDVSSRDPTVLIHRCYLKHPIKRGDLLKRCADDKVFEVQSSKPDSLSGVVCELLQWGATDQ